VGRGRKGGWSVGELEVLLDVRRDGGGRSALGERGCL
jgi:hypothetical protein